MINNNLASEVAQGENSSFESVLDQKVGMNYCAGDKDFYYEVLEAFIQSEFTNKLNSYFDKEDWKGYQVSIHGIKSGAKSIGAISLSELAFELEMALKERNDVALVREKHSTVLIEIDKVIKTINELLGREG